MTLIAFPPTVAERVHLASLDVQVAQARFAEALDAAQTVTAALDVQHALQEAILLLQTQESAALRKADLLCQPEAATCLVSAKDFEEHFK